VSPLQTRLKNFCSNAGIETIVFVLERWEGNMNSLDEEE
jgi:hypothetical protein